MVYTVIQLITKEDGSHSQTLWGTFYTEQELLEFCQYMVDSADPEGLKAFYVDQWDTTGKTQTPLLVFCQKHSVTKRQSKW